MNKILKNLGADVKDKLKEKKQPSWTGPMLAKLTDDRFSKESWIYERKLDGERCLAFIKEKDCALKSRNKKSLNKSYPEIEKALKKAAKKDCILDGEIVAFEGNVSSFARLQDRMHVKNKKEAKKTNIAVYYYIFDILHFDGYDLTKVPLKHRKAILKKALKFSKPLRFTMHKNKTGKSYYKAACNKGWEGIIAKDATANYVHSRSSKWLKFKCVNEQEFVISGYTDPEGSRKGFGAILIGFYKNKKLKYAGKVGTGFDDDTLEKLSKKFKKKKQDENPFDSDDMQKKGTHFVKPEFVCEIAFTEWTKDNKLRHPRFKGMRRDKSPKKVKKEKPS
jgi:DNA ligase D-like protein (predicted ligase)